MECHGESSLSIVADTWKSLSGTEELSNHVLHSGVLESHVKPVTHVVAQ